MAGQKLETIFRDCTLCEAHCGIQVSVDRAANRVVDIRGDKDDPLSHGYICPKATGLAGLSEDPDRLLHPVKKVGDSFVEISWEEAFTTIGKRFGAIRDEHGADAIATYLGNPNAHDFASNLSMPTLLRALGTKWRFSATSVDQLPKMFANQLLFGSAGSFAIPDIDHTDFFLVLGGNPLVSNGSIMTAPDMRGRLRRLRERGGQLVVVDPRRHLRRCDLQGRVNKIPGDRPARRQTSRRGPCGCCDLDADMPGCVAGRRPQANPAIQLLVGLDHIESSRVQ